MKAVILAGGLGTRISEETGTKPKPMVEIGGKPILWHIMKTYSHHGVNDFIVCLGYKGFAVKQFFASYFLGMSNVRFDLRHNRIDYLDAATDPWTVTLVDTGEHTMTGGRLARVREHIGGETFCMTYGDGVTDLRIPETIAFHRAHGGLATLTAVQPPGRFGAFTLHESQSRIASFREKPDGDGAWINGGFFVLEPGVLDYIEGDSSVFERDPMQNLAQDGQLHAYKHAGFWQSMDTLRDKMLLEDLWNSGKAPWKVWSERPHVARPGNSAQPAGFAALTSS